MARVDLYAKDARLVVHGMTEWSHGGRSGTRFTRIGRASVNRDGSLNVYLDFVPAQGQALHIRPLETRDEEGEQSRQQAPEKDIPF